MFKKKFNQLAPRFFFVFIICVLGCQTNLTLPSVNLSDQTWTTREGQAVWCSKRGAPEIAGELLLAANVDGRNFVQFTKTPLPFLIAQSGTNFWQLHSIPDNQTYSGYHAPPIRAIWLWLPPCLAGKVPPKPLVWRATGDHAWRLENSATGEFLEGYLNP